MSSLAESVVTFSRLFAVYERDAICCGTVTVPQCVVLQTLLDGTWDVSSLAESARVTNGAMTRLLDGLQKRGFVERARDPEDRRRVELRLTAEGKREAERLARMTEEAVEQILERIPADKRVQVVEAIDLLRQAVEQVGDDFRCC